MIEREVPPVVDGEEIVARPAVGVALPSRRCRPAVGPASPSHGPRRAAPSCRAARARPPRGRSSRPARTRPFPRGRRRACRAWCDSPARRATRPAARARCGRAACAHRRGRSRPGGRPAAPRGRADARSRCPRARARPCCQRPLIRQLMAVEMRLLLLGRGELARALERLVAPPGRRPARCRAGAGRRAARAPSRNPELSASAASTVATGSPANRLSWRTAVS